MVYLWTSVMFFHGCGRCLFERWTCGSSRSYEPAERGVNYYHFLRLLKFNPWLGIDENMSNIFVQVHIHFLNVLYPLDVCTTVFNHLTPNDPYMSHTVPLTSKRCILYIYSTNIGTEYFMLYTLHFFSSQCSLFHNANLFGSCIIHILYTGCAKIKKIMPARKG